MPATQTQATEKRGRGRPRKAPADLLETQSYSLPSDLITSCAVLARRRKVSASSVVAEAVARYLEQCQQGAF